MGSSNTNSKPKTIKTTYVVHKCIAEDKVLEVISKKSQNYSKKSALVRTNQQYLESKSHCIKKANWIWPEGKLPFVIHSSITQHMRNKLFQAMMEFQTKTPIQFFEIQFQNSFPEFIKFQKSQGNTSYTNWCGRKANMGEHSVYLLETQTKGTYIHEILHVLGFEHEQCRKDRNDYNRKPTVLILNNGYMIGKYDTNSIMHYYPSNEMTSKVNNPYIGQRECLSQGDIKGISFVYGDFQCTYDAFPEEYYPQPFYECIDCWGKDSCYGVCELCAFICHEGHQLIFHQVEKRSTFVCDCGRYQHQIGLCTRTSTKIKYVKQHMYLCYDCFDYENRKQNDNILGACLSCVRKCHQGHRVQYYGLSNNFFCDCGLVKCRKACNAQIQ